MRSFILLAVALCCQAAPQSVVPLVYTSASTPAGVTPAFSTLLQVVQGPKPVVLSTVPSVVVQPSPVSFRSAIPAGAAVPVPSPTVQVSSAPVPAVPALPLGLSATQYRSQDELGNVIFNHVGGPNSRSEVRTATGAQLGSFAYIDGAGKIQHRSYVSDVLGTRMAGTDLPVAPNETPAVAKARAALAEMQASSGGRSRRSISSLPLLKFPHTPITHSVTAATFTLPLTTYTTFPVVAQVAAPGIGSAVVAPAAPAAETTKPTLKAIDTLNPKPVAAVEQPAPSPVLVKAAPAQAVVAAPISSPTVALAAQRGPSTVVVKSAPAQSLGSVVAAAEPAVAVAALPAPTPVLVKNTASPRVALAAKPGPSTVVVKSVPAKPVGAPAVAASPAASPVLVKAAPAVPSVLVKSAPAAVAVSTPTVAVSVPAPTPLEAPNPPAPSPDVPFRGGKFHSQDELGQYSFGHFGGSNTRVETKDFLGHTRGSFAYVDPEGEVHVRKYAASSGHGFSVAGSDLPVDNNKPVEETPEVAQARRAHLSLKEAEKAAQAVVESAGPAVTTA